MPDKKLTDSEIKKALEDLVKCNNNEIDCGSCTLSKFYPRCPEEIGELALDLINRQEEKIKRQSEVIRNFQATKRRYEKYLCMQVAEIKELKKKVGEDN